MAHNPIRDDGAAAIASNLHNLAELDLGYNMIGNIGATEIAEQLNLLTDLDLEYNQIGGSGAAAIARHLHNLVRLDLAGNHIEADRMPSLLRTLSQHDRIQTLNIRNNPGCDAPEVTEIATDQNRRPGLERLHISGHDKMPYEEGQLLVFGLESRIETSPVDASAKPTMRRFHIIVFALLALLALLSLLQALGTTLG